MDFYILALQVIRTAFWLYGLLIFFRVISSWFPNLNRYKITHVIFSIVDPYLNLFRRFIPPIGGVMDISPIVAFFALQLIERIIIWALF